MMGHLEELKNRIESNRIEGASDLKCILSKAQDVCLAPR